jgi:hypothetical protein
MVETIREVITPPTISAVNAACEDLGITPDRIVNVIYVPSSATDTGAKFRVLYRADPFRPQDLVTRG